MSGLNTPISLKKIRSKRVHAGKDLKEVNFEIYKRYLILVTTVHVHLDFARERSSQLR